MISAELSRIVFGSIKHAKLNEHRDRVNRLGLNRKNSRVLAEFPKGLVAPVEPSAVEMIPGRRRQRRRIVRDLIREIAKCDRSRKLLKRVLLKGDAIGKVAAELRVSRTTAGSIECRGRRALGLASRRKKKST